MLMRSMKTYIVIVANSNLKGLVFYTPCIGHCKVIAKGRLYKKVIELTMISGYVKESEQRILYLITI